MKIKGKRIIRRNQRGGFSLVEVMVSIAIVSVVLGTLVGVFARSNQIYNKQNSSVALQQELRAAMEIMIMEIRMAGYNPTNAKSSAGKSDFGIVKKKGQRGTSKTEITFTVDWDGDKLDPDNPGQLVEGAGKIAKGYNSDGECEDRTFRWARSKQSVEMMCGTGSTFDLIGGTGSLIKVTDLRFEYYDEDGKEVSNYEWAKGVTISITGTSFAGATNATITRTFKSFVALRNV